MGAYDIRSLDSGVSVCVTLVTPSGSVISASGATNVNFAFFLPDQSTLIKTGEVFIDTDSVYKLRTYITGDVSMTSETKLQCQFTLNPSGFQGSTTEGKFSTFRKIGV